MLRPFLLLCTLIITPTCFAQQQELDSLLNALKNHLQSDTARLDILNNINFTYQTINPAKGLEKADEAIVLAERLNDTLRLATAYAYKGMNYGTQSQLSQALEMYNRAVNLLERVGNKKKIASIYNAIGNIYLNTSNFSNAVEYYFKALKGYEKYGNKLGLATANDNIGIVYTDLKSFPAALTYYTRALKLYEQLRNKKGIADALGNMANTYDDSGNAAKALDLYLKALQISDSIGYTYGVASDNANVGILYFKEGNYSKAGNYFRKAIGIFHQIQDENNEAFLLNKMAALYVKASNLVLLKSGVPSSKQYDTAQYYANKALHLAEKVGSLGVQADTWAQLSEIYEKKNKYAEALKAFKNYNALNDSIFSDKKKQDIIRMEIQYAFDKKQDSIKVENQKQQALAAAKLQQQHILNSSIMGGTGVLLLAGFTSFMFYKKRRDAEGQKQKAEFLTQVVGTEMKALRAQMNPHFILNSLSSIRAFILKNNTQAAEYYLIKFSRLMRLILNNSTKEEISLADDLNALEWYMQLEALQLNNKFTYEIKMDDAIDKEAISVPPLILQPFVENSIKHGIGLKEGKGKIRIGFEKEGEMLNCFVEDNGIGRAQAAMMQTNIEEKSGKGIELTKERIAIINALKPSNASLSLFDLEEGLRVEVKLPWRCRINTYR